MCDLNLLRSILHPDAIIALGKKHDKSVLTLSEPQESDSKVVIRNIPSGAIVVKIDDVIDSRRLFSGCNGECKRADFAIFSDDNGKKTVVFVEMKRTNAKKKNVVLQLKGATCVFEYCKAIGRIFHSRKRFLQDYSPRYVYFSQTRVSINKKPTRVDSRSKVHDNPDHPLILSGSGPKDFREMRGPS